MAGKNNTQADEITKTAQADEIELLKQQIAALQEKVGPVVANGPTPEEAAYANELVEIRLPKDRDHTDDVCVMVNGKAYLIQRGKKVEVPRFVAEVWWNAQDQEADAADFINGLQDDFDEKSSML